MSYIDLINRFWLIDIEANFSHLEVHLFFKLLQLNNKLGWKKHFRYPNTRLEAEINTQQNKLAVARQHLVDFGVIGYKKGTTRKAGQYTLFLDNTSTETKESNQGGNDEGNNRGNNVGNNEGNLMDNDEDNNRVITGTLNRLDKTRPDNNPLYPLFEKNGKIDFKKFFDFYHEKCPRLPKVKTINSARKKILQARIKEHGKENVVRMLDQVAFSPFLNGENERNWRADFDWLFKPANFVKVLDGNYLKNERNEKNHRNSTSSPKGIEQVAASILDEIEQTQC